MAFIFSLYSSFISSILNLIKYHTVCTFSPNHIDIHIHTRHTDIRTTRHSNYLHAISLLVADHVLHL